MTCTLDTSCRSDPRNTNARWEQVKKRQDQIIYCSSPLWQLQINLRGWNNVCRRSLKLGDRDHVPSWSQEQFNCSDRGTTAVAKHHSETAFVPKTPPNFPKFHTLGLSWDQWHGLTKPSAVRAACSRAQPPIPPCTALPDAPANLLFPRGNRRGAESTSAPHSPIQKLALWSTPAKGSMEKPWEETPGRITTQRCKARL